MMYIFTFIGSILVFFSFSLLAFLKREKQVISFSIALLGTLGSIFILTFPLYEEGDLFLKLWQDICFTIATPAMGEDIVALYKTLNHTFFLYRCLLYFYTLLAPLFTATVLFYYIRNKIDLFQSKRKTKKPVHIFTEFNEKAFLLAKSIKNKNNVVIICNKEKNIEYARICKKEKILFVVKNSNDLPFENYLGELTIYAIEKEESDNLNHTLEKLHTYRNKLENTTLYFFSLENTSRIILDSIDKGNITVILVNELERMIYDLLEKKPLYENAQEKIISVLIVGCGKVGKKFLREIIWCGQMVGYHLEINIIDLFAVNIEKNLLHDCPELNSKYYDITYHEVNLFTEEADKVLEKHCKNTNYIIVSLGNEEENIKGAIDLRKHYLQKNKYPFIGLLIEKEEKKKEVKMLTNERGENYQLYPFGSIKDLYSETTILNEKLEDLAKQVHLSYDPSDKEFKKYNAIEYNKKSSRSTALHIQYKMYSILGENGTIEALEEKLKDPKIVEALVKNEHDRWMAYQRADGYRCASIEKVKEYFPKTGKHIYYLAKLHPCLVPYEKLDKLSKELSNLLQKDFDFKKNDYEIVTAIPSIVKNAKTRD